MKKILKFGSYVLVAALAAALTLTMVTVQQRQEPRKLMQMEKLIQERFIGEVDQQAMEMRQRWPWWRPWGTGGATTLRPAAI